MSLLRDTDFLIHRLRLAYLRNVEDPLGPRIISLDPGYQMNPYNVSASLADPERWPELTLPSSPNLSEEEEVQPKVGPSRKARLRHRLLNNPTTAVLSSERGSTSTRTLTDTTPQPTPGADVPVPTTDDEMRNFITGHAPVRADGALAGPSSLPTNAPAAPPMLRMGSWIDLDADDVESPGALAVTVQAPSAPAEAPAPVTKVVQFIPKFKGAAEMEARRRVRMAARRGPQAAAPPPSKPLSMDTSSEEEDEGESSSSESSDGFEHVGDATDVVDEFDPDFAATRASAVSDSTSELASNISIDNSSLSHSPLPARSPLANAAITGPRARFQPDAQPRHRHHHAHAGKPDAARSGSSSPTARRRFDSSSTNSGDPVPSLFVKKKVPPRPTAPPRSALSFKLASSTSANPFGELYSPISGRGAGAAARRVQAFFPHAEQPRGRALELTVRTDATVEEVLGFALWSYWEARWLPKLDDGLTGETDPRWGVRLSTVGWVLRMAEDDGEIDDDCPAPDRGKKAKEFLDLYAIVEATPTQVQQNQVFEAQLQRKAPSATKKAAEKLSAPSASFTPGLSVAQSGLSASLLSSSPGLSSSHGPQVLLRVHTENAVQILTTIKVFSGTYMQEAFDLVCRRQRIDTPNDYVLLLADKSVVIPLDRTVASLQGKRELSLVRRSMLPSLGLKMVGKTTDPNASIFTKPKRMSDGDQQPTDVTEAYKEYTVFRRLPVLVTRQERTLAIDGDYIRIMPRASRARAVFDSGKTASYHISAIAQCGQSRKNSALFKLILNRAGAHPPKRYDFEAENAKTAADIVENIRNARPLDRSWSTHKSRRSRHIV